MKLIFLMAGLAVGLYRLALADATNLVVKISAREAAAHYDQLMTVTGIVVQVSLRPSIVFINLDQPYPDSPFVAIIHSKDTNQFNDLRGLKGRSVEITGKVQNYRDRPEIVLEKSGQIIVSGGWLAPSNSPTAVPRPAPPASKKPDGTNDLTTGVM
jgi:DNA/RNA endonuclease YhcR with UshA esterase domain